MTKHFSKLVTFLFDEQIGEIIENNQIFELATVIYFVEHHKVGSKQAEEENCFPFQNEMIDRCKKNCSEMKKNFSAALENILGFSKCSAT